MSAALTVLVGFVVVTGPAAADEMDDLQDQQDQNAAEREQLASALEGTDAELAATYLALADTNYRLPIAEAELVTANAELAAAERHRDSVQSRLEIAQGQQADLLAEIADGEAEIVETEGAMGEVARSAYRGNGSVSALAVVLDATSTEDFASQYSVMNSALRTQNQTLTDLENLTAINRNRQVRLDAVEVRISELRDEAEAAVAAAEVARQTAADLVTEIAQLKADQEAQAASLETLKAEQADRQAELEAENQQIASEISALAAEQAAERARQEAALAAQQNSGGGGGGSGGGGGGGGGVPAPPSGSIFIPPISRSLHVTSSYGYRVYPITGGWFMHNGVDLRSSCGEAQMASAAGRVIAVRGAAGNGTHGNQVMIDHGVIGARSYVTVYNHLSRFNTSVGDRVSQGQVIGYTGATGNVTGCHVHFEIWRNGSTVDPMNYF
ncbi:murein hydrolase activator EnvC family protein [Occultella gossypii]|uniref:Peptidoglycan DD-metalloendopeptidase family protein n=1 Tax=Occultella gossypii TaxID=2800820 RepID=A0ABS7SB64_9MICO|nr:M23 family metallopeptidase [Occultella gossypii]MBZ2197512.1 peptidoglycan DD-metalloendopeptidase family protein [Occultella gossypii]